MNRFDKNKSFIEINKRVITIQANAQEFYVLNMNDNLKNNTFKLNYLLISKVLNNIAVNQNVINNYNTKSLQLFNVKENNYSFILQISYNFMCVINFMDNEEINILNSTRTNLNETKSVNEKKESNNIIDYLYEINYQQLFIKVIVVLSITIIIHYYKKYNTKNRKSMKKTYKYD